jgi:hypothetical protein
MNWIYYLLEHGAHFAVQSIVFAAEFVLMKNGIETTCGLHCKFIMMSMALDDPTYVYGDNMSVFHIMQCSESFLEK